jgi:adenosylcobinamide-GDP ribazoletransferase
MGFFDALGFLTILPVPQGAKLEPGKALPYFPLIGILLGLVLLGLNYGLKYLLPSGITAALLITALAIFTGGHHLDGLADTFGGLRGNSKETRLELMANTGASTAGAAAVIILLLVKYLALRQADIVAALVLSPTLARSIVLSAIFIFPSARSNGMGNIFKKGLGWRGLALATIIALSAVVILMGLNGLILAVLLYIITLGFAYYLNGKLGGLTGDCYGALIEIGEAMALALIIVL